MNSESILYKKLTLEDYKKEIQKAYDRFNYDKKIFPEDDILRLMYCCYIIPNVEFFSFLDVCIVNRLLKKVNNNEDIRDYINEIILTEEEERELYNYSYDIVMHYYLEEAPNFDYVYNYDHKLFGSNFYKYISNYFNDEEEDDKEIEE